MEGQGFDTEFEEFFMSVLDNGMDVLYWGQYLFFYRVNSENILTLESFIPTSTWLQDYFKQWI